MGRRFIEHIVNLPWPYRLRLSLPGSRLKGVIQSSQLGVDKPTITLRNTYQLANQGDPISTRYVIAADTNDIYSGLGAMLHALAPAWLYAKRTGRTLVIDWRGNPYLRDEPEANLFNRLFEQPDPNIIGTPFVADDTVNQLAYPQPILGPSKVMKQENGELHQLEKGLDLWTMRGLFANGIDVDAPTLIPSLSALYGIASVAEKAISYGFPWPALKEYGSLYSGLKPLPVWTSRIAEFAQKNMHGRNVIGVHIRHGNGEGQFRSLFQDREINDFPDFVSSIAAKINHYGNRHFGGDYTTFLCTDSTEVIEALEPLVPKLVTQEMWRPEPGQGVDFDHGYKRPGGGLETAATALIDMMLLAKCDVVMMTRPSSFGVIVPYIMERPGSRFLDSRQTAKLPG